MARRPSTIGSNPLDAVVPIRQAESPEQPTPAVRERVTAVLPAELMERARNVVYWSPGTTLAGMIEAGITAEVEKAERDNGGPFKPRGRALKPGRRFKD